MSTPTPRGRPIRAVVLVAALAVALALTWWVSRPQGSVPGSPGRSRVEALVSAVAVVPERVKRPGYQRDCSGTAACVFGPAWSDSTTAPGSGNGCPTRQDVLARDLVGAARDPGDGCAVRGGRLVDPYSGAVVDVAVTGVRGIHVDHVLPLAAAWDLGAADWPAPLRARFANDVDLNLLAVSGPVNTAKGDATPAAWMPPDPRRHCFYAARYLGVAVAYGLPVTEADRDELRRAARRCPADGA